MDLFYFLLIRTKRPKLPKFPRAVSSSYELHAIPCISRNTRIVAFLLILLQKADSGGMRKSLHKVPTVLDFALIVYSSRNLCFVALLVCRSVVLSLCRYVAPLICCSVTLSCCCSVAMLLHRSVALSLCCSVALSLCRFIAPSLCPSVSLLLRRSSLCRSFAPSIAPYTINLFLFSFLYFNIQTYLWIGMRFFCLSPDGHRCQRKLRERRI